MVQALSDVQVIGDGAHHGHAASVAWRNTLAHELGRIHQQTGRHAFAQAVTLERTGGSRDAHQLRGCGGIDARFTHDDLGFQLGQGVIKIKCHKALFG